MASISSLNGASPIYVAVVDDDESLCRSLGRLLRAEGMHAITYPSAEEFLADSKRPQFGCLVLDIRLDGMSGLELAHKLVESGHHAPFIFVTAHNSDAMRAEAEAVGGSAFFSKTDAGTDIIYSIRKLTRETA
jgi:FixJ family two-component response regulator